MQNKCLQSTKMRQFYGPKHYSSLFPCSWFQRRASWASNYSHVCICTVNSTSPCSFIHSVSLSPPCEFVHSVRSVPVSSSPMNQHKHKPIIILPNKLLLQSAHNTLNVIVNFYKSFQNLSDKLLDLLH